MILKENPVRSTEFQPNTPFSKEIHTKILNINYSKFFIIISFFKNIPNDNF